MICNESSAQIETRHMRMGPGRLFRRQISSKRRHTKVILRNEDVYYCEVMFCLDLDLNPLNFKAEHPLRTYAQLI